VLAGTSFVSWSRAASTKNDPIGIGAITEILVTTMVAD
jgi:hypothetical protein